MGTYWESNALLMELNMSCWKNWKESNDVYIIIHTDYIIYIYIHNIIQLRSTKDFIISIENPSLSPPTSHAFCPGVASVSSAAARSGDSADSANGAVAEDLTWEGLVLPTCQVCQGQCLSAVTGTSRCSWWQIIFLLSAKHSTSCTSCHRTSTVELYELFKVHPKVPMLIHSGDSVGYLGLQTLQCPLRWKETKVHGKPRPQHQCFWQLKHAMLQTCSSLSLQRKRTRTPHCVYLTSTTSLA